MERYFSIIRTKRDSSNPFEFISHKAMKVGKPKNFAVLTPPRFLVCAHFLHLSTYQSHYSTENTRSILYSIDWSGNVDEKWTQSEWRRGAWSTHRKSRNTKGTSYWEENEREKQLKKTKKKKKKWKEDVTVIVVEVEEEEEEEAIVEIEIVSKYRWSRDVGPVE